MSTPITAQLEQLVNQEFSYKGNNILIQEIKKLSSGFIVIKTSGRSYNFYPDEVRSQFIDLLQPKQEKKELKHVKQEEVSVNVLLKQENQPVKDALLDALRKVQQDANYVEQATALCNISNSLINIQKMELSFYKLQNQK